MIGFGRLRPNLALVIGGTLTAMLIATAVVSTFWTPEVPTRARVALRLRGPLEAGLLGTDHFGRDVASLLMAGAWNSLAVAWPAVLLGAAIGIVLGGTQALSRSLFSQLIPRGKEGEYYGFYEISDKGTSWLGPLAFGLVFQVTDSYRAGIVSLVVFFVVGGVLLALVPMRRAIVAAGNTPPRLL